MKLQNKMLQVQNDVQNHYKDELTIKYANTNYSGLKSNENLGKIECDQLTQYNKNKGIIKFYKKQVSSINSSSVLDDLN